MNDTPIKIHEFSTGIKPGRDASGNWISRGFTGRYMNCTLPEIPYNVERAIANQLFAVVEGYTTEQPAIIGRVVLGNPNSRNELGKLDWSVVAIVSLGRDEKGRPLTAYRYFLSPGFTLHKVVDWIEQSQQNSEGRLPVFDPNIKKNIGDCYKLSSFSYPIVTLKEGLKRRLNNEPSPILYTGQHKNFRDQLEQVNLKEIHYSAAYKAANEDRAISWAYNVEALEFPESFILIHTANKDACRRIKDALNDSDSSISRMLPAATVDMQMLKSSIKSLMSGSVKRNTVMTIVEALEDDLVTEDIWQRIFDGEGATRGIQQNIYSPPMLRLLTLRAVAIPRTLPDFLNWFKNHHDLINKKEFLNFQSKFRDCTSRFLELEDNLFQGVIQAFESLKKPTKVPPKLLSYFLGQQKSFWNVCFYRLLEGVNRDLEKICHQQTDIKYSQILCQDIINYKNSYSYKKQKKSILPEYKPFAILFEHLAKYDRNYLKLSAYFYQISQGLVADKLFREAFGNSRLEEAYLGITIQKQLTSKEKILSQFSNLSKAVINFFKKIAGLVFKPAWFILNKLSSLIWKFIAFVTEFLWRGVTQFVYRLTRLTLRQQIGILASIYSVAIILLFIRVFGIPEIPAIKISINPILNFIDPRLLAAEPKEFNRSAEFLNAGRDKLASKTLNTSEKFLFVEDELALTDGVEQKCIQDKSSFPQANDLSDDISDSINKECRKNIAEGLKDYETKISNNEFPGSIVADGIIEPETIQYIETQISGLFEPGNDRYEQITVPIVKKLVEQVQQKIDQLKENDREINTSYWLIIALKNSITPENENIDIPSDFISLIVPSNTELLENPRKLTKNLIQHLPYSDLEKIKIIPFPALELNWLQKAWIERIFSACLKSEECSISSTITEADTINKFQNFVELELLDKIDNIANKNIERASIVIELKNVIENKFNKQSIQLSQQDYKSNIPSFQTAMTDFVDSKSSIQGIEDSIYQELLMKLDVRNNLDRGQEEKIRKVIRKTIKKTLSTANGEQLVDISKIDIDRTKKIKLNKLQGDLNIDNLDHFKNQLNWIEAIFDYQKEKNDYHKDNNDEINVSDGIISFSTQGIGKNLKDSIIRNKIDSLTNKAQSIINSSPN